MVAEALEEHPPDKPRPGTAVAEFKLILRTVTPRLWLVPAIIVVNVAVFSLMVARGVDAFDPTVEQMVAWGANYGPNTLGGQPWRLPVSLFLHFGAIHLLMNMLALWYAGRLVERIFGHACFAALYLAGGVCGSVASLLVHPYVVFAGASGAVFGVYGALGAFLLRERGAIPMPTVSKLSRVALGFIGYNILYGFIHPNIDVASYLGGALGGAAAGTWLARPLVPGRQNPTQRPAMVAALALAIAAAALVMLPKPVDLARGLDDLKAGNEAYTHRDYDEAIRLYTRGLTSGNLSVDNQAYAFNNRGLAWAHKRDDDRAIADYNEAIRLNPGLAGAFIGRGNVWLNKKDSDRAIADYSEAIRLNPRLAGAFTGRGNVWLDKKDSDRAIADYNEAIRLNPRSVEAFIGRGNVWFDQKKDDDRAIADYSEAIRLKPLALMFDNRGQAWARKKDYDRAIADYDEAIRLNPQDPNAFNNRGVSWVRKADYERAIADYNEAIRLDPTDAFAFNNRGLAWAAKTDYERAIADYNEAIRLNPRYSNAFNNRGRARFHQGEFRTAATDLAQSQQLAADPYTALWLYLARARGGAANAKTELLANTRDMKAGWPGPVVALYLGRETPKMVTGKAAHIDPQTHEVQLCEATFYVGAWQLLKGDKIQARLLLQKAVSECPKDLFEFLGAGEELERLN